MNVYYGLAILCLAASAFFGYLGSNVESSKSDAVQLKQISEKFDELGAQVTELKKNDITIEDVDVINNKYKELAQEYMKALPLEAQGLVIAKETKKLKLINDSIKYANKLNEIRALSKDIVLAFQSSGANIYFTDMEVPKDIFGEQFFNLKIYATESEYWSIHLVDKESNRIGVMFVRVIVEDNIDYLTNDSIVFRWFPNEQYAFSLNSKISDNVKDRVALGLSLSKTPLINSNAELELLIQNIVKYELIEEIAEK